MTDKEKIKELEKEIERLKESVGIWQQQDTLGENIILDMKKHIKQLKHQLKVTEEQLDIEFQIVANSIPKSKIKERIEELKRLDKERGIPKRTVEIAELEALLQSKDSKKWIK